MWLNPQISADLVSFTKEILNEKLHFLCSENTSIQSEAVTWRFSIKKDFLKKFVKLKAKE